MRIKVLSTGGTIAMKFDPASGGAVPILSGEDLVKTIPGIGALSGNIEIEDIANIPSDYIGPVIWKKMALRLNEILDDVNIIGVVITHGTDTLEETAYFLDLIVTGDKPVVVTGSQRNASEWDNDGPRNILYALKVVAHKNSVGMGVMVCLNGQICAARDARKSHTFSIETFNSGTKGFLGEIVNEEVKFYRKPVNRLPPFSVESMVSEVDIIQMYTGADGKYIDLAVKSGVSGIVIQAFGLGNVSDVFYKAIKTAIEKRVVVVISTRVPDGFAFPAYGFEGSGTSLRKIGAIFSGDLSPWKARILLMLALKTVKDIDALQNIFST